MNDLFRSGRLPEPLPQGRYRGEMLIIRIALLRWIANAWMPWRGKTFRPSQGRGDNIFTRDSYRLARVFNPLYRGFFIESSETYRAFAFRTYTGAGLMDADRKVLKIDYNLKENPVLTVRRVLDELVQLEQDLYLGKAHVRWGWRSAGGWQTVAFFSLVPDGLAFV